MPTPAIQTVRVGLIANGPGRLHDEQSGGVADAASTERMRRDRPYVEIPNVARPNKSAESHIPLSIPGRPPGRRLEDQPQNGQGVISNSGCHLRFHYGLELSDYSVLRFPSSLVLVCACVDVMCSLGYAVETKETQGPTDGTAQTSDFSTLGSLLFRVESLTSVVLSSCHISRGLGVQRVSFAEAVSFFCFVFFYLQWARRKR